MDTCERCWLLSNRAVLSGRKSCVQALDRDLLRVRYVEHRSEMNVNREFRTDRIAIAHLAVTTNGILLFSSNYVFYGSAAASIFSEKGKVYGGRENIQSY